MKPNKTEIADIFNTHISQVDTIPCGGIHITLKKPTEMLLQDKGEKKLRGGFEKQYAHEGLWELVRMHGVVAVKNAFVMQKRNTELSGRVDEESNGLVEQDFFHWDSLFRHKVTLLHKYLMNGRRMDTDYVRRDDVQEVLRRWRPEITIRGKKKIEAAFDAMIEPGYNYSLDKREYALRAPALELPDLTHDLLKQVPQDRVYRKHWFAGELEVVMHFNDARTGVLHGRQAFGSRFVDIPEEDCLEGITFGRD